MKIPTMQRRVRRMMALKGMSQARVALFLGVRRDAITRLLGWPEKIVTDDDIMRIQNALGRLSSDVLFRVLSVYRDMARHGATAAEIERANREISELVSLGARGPGPTGTLSLGQREAS